MSPIALNTKPTIVLVHGAFADSSSWNEVISALAAANRLRGVYSDSAAFASLLAGIDGPLLVGHT